MPSQDCSNCTLCRLNQLYILNHNSKNYNKKTAESIAPHKINTMSPSNSTSHPSLRLLTALSLPFSFAFILPFAILDNALILIGLIPLSISALLSIVHHRRDARSASIRFDKKSHWSCLGVTSTLVEMLLPVVYLVCLVPIWMKLGGSWRSTMVLVGTYGTVGMVANMLIHTYITLRAIPWARFGLGTTCPECRAKSQTQQRAAPMAERSGGMYQKPGAATKTRAVDARDGEEEDSPGVEYDDARSDVDDETARLV
ncbi:unnamed protein product [Zymoseptoria tritici ST99CH_1A5]|uniref:Uncharacterized protein n=2 Tax=Zymoseptoria tritici TaxID=1047171 RepID=A0A2H1GY51_ZYMTR|nr:unnamed protein product [Zymoseptoria tritici ST99CH_1E4]SMY27693.1 unnamed protein product [Zymoseptoria tritici ST99CH_1A5]